MTPDPIEQSNGSAALRALAEKIVAICDGQITPTDSQVGILDMVEDVLREALAEARYLGFVEEALDCAEHCDSAYAKGRAEGLTRAAKVCRQRAAKERRLGIDYSVCPSCPAGSGGEVC